MTDLVMCDRCKKLLGTFDVFYRFDCNTIIVHEQKPKEHTVLYKDFCEDCKDDILKFMMQGTEEEE